MKKITFLTAMLISGISIQNSFGQQPADNDPTFNIIDNTPNPLGPDTEFGGGVNAIAIQTDGKVLIGGQFATVDNEARSCIARLNADGNLDLGFTVGSGLIDDIISPQAQVNEILVQPDGKILIAGEFQEYNGSARANILRLNADGTLDYSFDPGTGTNSAISGMALLPSGKIIIYGNFNSYNGIIRNKLARLNNDGSLDTGFNTGFGLGFTNNATLNDLAVQTDGKIVIVGFFDEYNTVQRFNVARINTDGSVDVGYNPGDSILGGAISQIEIQSDDRAVLYGQYLSGYQGNPQAKLIRINEDGSFDQSFDPGLSLEGAISEMKLVTGGKLFIAGNLQSYDGVSIGNNARLNPDGSLDTGFDTSGPNLVDCVAERPDGKLIIGGYFFAYTYQGVPRPALAQVNLDGTLNTEFIPLPTGAGLTTEIRELRMLPDDKIMAVGEFTYFNQVPRSRITRLNADGSLDPTFDPGTGADDLVRAIAVQPDGKVIIGGFFEEYNETLNVNRLARINTDGSLDAEFTAQAGGPNLATLALELQDDGKIIVGGQFYNFNGIFVEAIVRLNPDGSFDNTFFPGTSVDNVNYFVRAVHVQPDGKILVGGYFESFNGTPAGNIVRLNEDGSVDQSFSTGSGFDLNVIDIEQQADGKIIVIGAFSSFNGTNRRGIARLNNDGSLDTSFDPGTGTDNGNPIAVLLEPNGKILIGGTFTTYNGIANNRIARLNADGSLDNGFEAQPGANSTVRSIALQSDGKPIIGGDFTDYSGAIRHGIARLYGGQSTVELQDVDTEHGLLAYPNPTSGDFTIAGTKANHTIEVYNNMGQLLLRQNAQEQRTSVNLKQQAPGIYHVHVIGDNEVIRFKLIKQ